MCRLQRHSGVGHGLDAVLVAQGQRQAALAFRQRQMQRHLAVGRTLGERRFPAVVAVAVDLCAGLQARQGADGFVREHAPALALLAFAQLLHCVDADADAGALVHVVQAIAVGQRCVRHQLDEIRTHFADGAHAHAQVLRRIEGADVVLAALGEIVGVAAVEILVDVGREEDLRVPAGGAHEARAALEDLVEQQAIVGRDVLHVAHVLVAALDLERADAGVDQRLQVAALVVVLHRQQVLVVGHDAALAIGQRVRQAASLGTVAAVGAAARVGVRDIALAGERDAQGAVDEVFERRVDLCADLADLGYRQFACQHQLGEADVAQELRFLYGADVALRAGVQLDRREVEFEQAHVLDDQRIDAGLVQLPDLLAREIELGVVHDRVHRDEDAGAVAVSELDQAGEIFEGVAGIVAGAECGAADVDGVGAVQDGLAADLGGFGGRQQFELVV